MFTGLGKLKNYKLKLHVLDSIQPIAQPYRRVPFSTREKVLERLKELEKLDVIETVTTPASWVNPLVTIEKSNGISPNILICLDMRRANEAVAREKHPVPTVEETLQEISGAKVFCQTGFEHGLPQDKS